MLPDTGPRSAYQTRETHTLTEKAPRPRCDGSKVVRAGRVRAEQSLRISLALHVAAALSHRQYARARVHGADWPQRNALLSLLRARTALCVSELQSGTIGCKSPHTRARVVPVSTTLLSWFPLWVCGTSSPGGGVYWSESSSSSENRAMCESASSIDMPTLYGDGASSLACFVRAALWRQRRTSDKFQRDDRPTGTNPRVLYGGGCPVQERRPTQQ